jgi:hypothetical protein
MQIRNKRDFLGGLLLIGFGLAALLIARDYRMGTSFRMGPGYFPVVLAGLLITIGIIIAISSLKASELNAPQLAWRPLLVVTGAVVLFGLLINSTGLLLTTVLLIAASRLSRAGYPWIETAVLAALLSLLCALVFSFALKIQMPLLPTWI